MKGIEYLRGVYISSGLSIKPKTRLNKLEALKEMIRAWGLNPDQVMSREALAQSNTTVIDRAQLEQTQLTQLTAVLKATDDQRNLRESRSKKYEFTPGTK